jgi:uncharacterized membrane protein YphA (DoxX/SURF4 family)
VDAIEPASWKSGLSWACASTLAALFLVSGVWKLADPMGWAVRITELRVPQSAGLAAAIVVGIAETVGAVWILVPRFRRWGSILIAGLLAAFVVYFALNYSALRGADCSCFPWIKRVVGPGFFLGDAAMLLLALAAGMWARKPIGARPAVVILASITVFALVSWGVETQQRSGARAPAAVTVNGQPMSIAHGKYFVFFFNPACMHCSEVAKHMAQLQWRDTTLIAVPTDLPEFAPQFLNEAGLRGVVSPDFANLRKPFGYTAYPYGVAVQDGRQKASIPSFENGEPDATLKRLGFVQ